MPEVEKNLVKRAQQKIAKIRKIDPELVASSENRELYRLAMVKSAGRLVPGIEGLPIAKALGAFVEKLYDTPGVEAVALLTVAEPCCPTVLSARVFNSLDPTSDEAGDMIDAVTDARATLDELLRSQYCISTGMRFIDVGEAGLEPVKQKFVKRWLRDPQIGSIRTIIFQH